MRKISRFLLPIALLLAGLAILLYPAVSSYINQLHSSQAIQSFTDQMEDTADEALLKQLELAQGYNARLSADGMAFGEVSADYYEILDFGNGMMGYIEIPRIDVRLPICHGTDALTLQSGVGHMPQSAFPIGGEGSHAVLTGHTGLPSAQLLTDLYKLEIGDVFHITVGNRTITYTVDQIKTVLPENTGDLRPAAGKDYCTLVTCTPYGINTHRLLVRGVRQVNS